jgi:coatomer subunit delta
VNGSSTEVSIEYSFDNSEFPCSSFRNFVISIPLPDDVFPTVSDSSAETCNGSWEIDHTNHTLIWKIEDHESNTGNLDFTCNGDDVGAFFPVEVGFVCQKSLCGVTVSFYNILSQRSCR